MAAIKLISNGMFIGEWVDKKRYDCENKNALLNDDGEMPRLEGVWSFLRNILFINNEFAKKNLIEW